MPRYKSFGDLGYQHETKEVLRILMKYNEFPEEYIPLLEELMKEGDWKKVHVVPPHPQEEDESLL